ncbi:MAG: hypothetical protein C4575_06920 [Desulforudis sp.]|nr:MAG: hypothetical protein C4575_06920 [Desulforudis sp.]
MAARRIYAGGWPSCRAGSFPAPAPAVDNATVAAGDPKEFSVALPIPEGPDVKIQLAGPGGTGRKPVSCFA